MKGVFERRSASPKYKSTWDVNVVLQSLRKFDHVKTVIEGALLEAHHTVNVIVRSVDSTYTPTRHYVHDFDRVKLFIFYFYTSQTNKTQYSVL